MIGEVDLYGVFVPTLGLAMIVAFGLSIPLRRALQAIGFYGLVWHRPLFDLALYIVLLGATIGLGRRIFS